MNPSLWIDPDDPTGPLPAADPLRSWIDRSGSRRTAPVEDRPLALGTLAKVGKHERCAMGANLVTRDGSLGEIALVQTVWS